MSYALASTAAAVRWSARVLGGATLLVWCFFLIAHLVGDEGRPSRPPVWGDYVALSSLAASLAGLALAWRWERAGAAVTLAAVWACAAANWKVLLFTGTLVLAAAVLRLLSWRARGSLRQGDAARVR